VLFGLVSGSYLIHFSSVVSAKSNRCAQINRHLINRPVSRVVSCSICFVKCELHALLSTDSWQDASMLGSDQSLKRCLRVPTTVYDRFSMLKGPNYGENDLYHNEILLLACCSTLNEMKR
jgi:hypothetical protein